MVLTVKQLNAQMKKREQKYLKRADGRYECSKCGSIVMAVRVAHPIWDGPFAMGGSGKCHYEDWPYCPKCEEEPSFHGDPIAPKGSYHNP